MTRDQALALVQANVRNQNLIKHMLASEAIMKALARRLGQDEEEWGLAGLLHDLDVELTEGKFEDHGRVGAYMAREAGASETVCRTIMAHNEVYNIPRNGLIEKAIFCADPLTGLVTAGALVRPDKKLASLTADSLVKRFGEKSFARGASREHIALCREIDLELRDFIELGLRAMQSISDDLGL